MADNAIKILVVEDETSTREITTYYLVEAGFDAVSFSSAYDALKYLGENPLEEFNIMILDKIMPGIDGINLTKLLRFDLRYKHTPIIMITSVDNDDSRKEAKMAGVSEYIVKPVERDYLIKKIHDYLKK